MFHLSFFLRVLVFLSLTLCTESKAKDEALFYNDQTIDHLSTTKYEGQTWSQRYYVSSSHFAGPGHPIFLIMGGEAAAETGIYYPFIRDHLAKDFGAFVLQPEHRFYGASQPIHQPGNNEDLKALMTSEQSMHDAVQLLRHFQIHELGCSVDRTSVDYCPVITVGGSYPGFLSAMMRVVHPEVVDMSYAASAPMKFYSQNVLPNAYYDHITAVAESASEGCSQAVEETLMWVVSAIGDEEDSVMNVAQSLGICPASIPSYALSPKTFVEELMMIVGFTFANYNMAYYPPDSNSSLFKACQIFQNGTFDYSLRMKTFLRGIVTGLGGEGEKRHRAKGSRVGSPKLDVFFKNDCVFDMSSQLPSGNNATISSGDWSGVGSGNNGKMWDFQTCSLLIEQIGFSQESMFPQRDWTFDWLKRHCLLRFDIVPDPSALTKKWHFDDLVGTAKASHILFTNGLNDGWSVSGITENLSENILALNFVDGAHHSDLTSVGPSFQDTDAVKQGFIEINRILQLWIAEIEEERILNANTRISKMSK